MNVYLAEFAIPRSHWKGAFRRDQLYEAVEAFQHRDRRFGRISG